jgi:hypothetical protein
VTVDLGSFFGDSPAIGVCQRLMKPCLLSFLFSSCLSFCALTSLCAYMTEVGEIVVWNYYADARRYCGQALVVSTTGEFDGEQQAVWTNKGEFAGKWGARETAKGNRVTLKVPVVTRYIRYYCAINTVNHGVYMVRVYMLRVILTSRRRYHGLQCEPRCLGDNTLTSQNTLITLACATAGGDGRARAAYAASESARRQLGSTARCESHRRPRPTAEKEELSHRYGPRPIDVPSARNLFVMFSVRLK